MSPTHDARWLASNIAKAWCRTQPLLLLLCFWFCASPCLLQPRRLSGRAIWTLHVGCVHAQWSENASAHPGEWRGIVERSNKSLRAVSRVGRSGRCGDSPTFPWSPSSLRLSGVWRAHPSLGPHSRSKVRAIVGSLRTELPYRRMTDNTRHSLKLADEIGHPQFRRPFKKVGIVYSVGHVFCFSLSHLTMTMTLMNVPFQQSCQSGSVEASS